MQLGDLVGAEAMLEAALAHWQSKAGAKDAAVGPGLPWCLSQLVGVRVCMCTGWQYVLITTLVISCAAE